MTCDAVFGAGSENFGTVTGNVTFQTGSANSGTVTGNAVFEGNAENKAGAIVTGDATFGILSINNGTVNGTITPPNFDLSPAEGQPSLNVFLMSNSTTIQQYTAGGYYNGLYAFVGNPYATLAEAEAAFAAYVLESNYIRWLAANVGVNQFIEIGNPHDGQWAYGSTAYDNQSQADYAEITAYNAWLTANVGVNQYGGTGAKNGQWASNSTEYASQEEAQVAYDAYIESLFAGWLQNNSLISQYTNPGSKNGKWFWGNDPTEYATQEEAQAAYNAANP